MTTSVQTNMSALVALQNLNATNRDLVESQNRVSTGLSVGGAKDNAAVFAVAQNMRADIGAYAAVKTSLDRARSIADVALAAGESISNLLVEMRNKVTAALDPSLDAASRAAYNEDFAALRRQINSIINNANFDGANLINGSLAAGIQFLADAEGVNRLTLNVENMNFSGSIITLSTTQNINSVTNAQAALTALQASITNVNAALARFGSSSKMLEAHQTFVVKLSDTLTGGIGNLVDADLARESANLQALQVKQQLGSQALSIANAAPQALLSLFRG
jgi:flagellin